MSEGSLFEKVTDNAQSKFDQFMAGGDFNPFSVAHTSVREALAEVTDADYGKLVGERPHLLQVAFSANELPVTRFTVRRMLNEALVPEFEKAITYDKLDQQVLEKFAGRELPVHMAPNFRAAVSARLGATIGGV
jgi:hypothetical protein